LFKLVKRSSTTLSLSQLFGIKGHSNITLVYAPKKSYSRKPPYAPKKAPKEKIDYSIKL
jgi:hypothetical protein